MTTATDDASLAAPSKDQVALYQAMVELDKRKCEESYAYFAWRAWDILEPGTPLQWNWHLDVLCAELEKQARRINKREPKEYDLIINVPPRSLKSFLVSKCFQPWVWTWDPKQRFLTSSYEQGLAFEQSVASRRIVQSEWYQERWGHVFQYTGDQNAKQFHENNNLGYRMATSVGGSGTGRGGDCVIVDDAQSAREADSETKRVSANEWWDRDMSTRLNDPRIGIFIVVQQRLHENDLTGHILSDKRRIYKRYCLPAEDGDNVEPQELRKFYSKTGLLFPARMDEHYLDGMKISLRDYGYAGQFLQRPSPPEGGIFKRQWWKFWKPAGMQLPAYEIKIGEQIITPTIVDLPEKFDDSVCSWDMSFKKADDSDYVVGQVWGSVKADKYLLDQNREQRDFPSTVDAVVELKARHPQTNAVLIEAKANGQAVIDQIKRDVPGIIGINPQGSKTARAQPMARQAQSGNIFLPHPAIAPWVEGFIERFAAFPNVAYDDEIDTASQAINELSGVQRVWPDYGGQTYAYSVAFDRLEPETLLLCSQWVDKNNASSIIFATWNPRKHLLAIFDELVTNTPRPEAVIPIAAALIKKDSKGILPHMKQFQWYGSKLMFSHNDGSDLRVLYRKFRVNLIDNTRYDEFAARQFVARLMFRKNLLIHSRCAELSRQMGSWAMDGNKPAEGHSLCRALCNVASILNEQSRFLPEAQGIKPYSQESTMILKELQALSATGNVAAMERIQKTAAKRLARSATTRRPGDGKSKWMRGL